MRWLDPGRPRTLGGREAWADAPRFALPSPEIDPTEGQKFVIRLMLAREDFSARWVQAEPLGLVETANFLVEWTEDPEVALRKWFGEEPPRGVSPLTPKRLVVPSVVQAPEGANVEDLDL